MEDWIQSEKPGEHDSVVVFVLVSKERRLTVSANEERREGMKEKLRCFQLTPAALQNSLDVVHVEVTALPMEIFYPAHMVSISL